MTTGIIVAPNASGLPLGPQSEYFTLSGFQSPGQAILQSCDATQGWDIRKGYGLMWANIVPAGEELTVVVFRIKIWTDSQYQDWLTFGTEFLSRPAPAPAGTTKTKAFGFWHLLASAPPYNVTDVVVLKVTALKYEPSEDCLVAEVHLLEWKQPLPAPQRPDQGTPSVEGGLPTAQDKIDAETNSAVEDGKSLETQAAAL